MGESLRSLMFDNGARDTAELPLFLSLRLLPLIIGLDRQIWKLMRLMLTMDNHIHERIKSISPASLFPLSLSLSSFQPLSLFSLLFMSMISALHHVSVIILLSHSLFYSFLFFFFLPPPLDPPSYFTLSLPLFSLSPSFFSLLLLTLFCLSSFDSVSFPGGLWFVS